MDKTYKVYLVGGIIMDNIVYSLTLETTLITTEGCGTCEAKRRGLDKLMKVAMEIGPTLKIVKTYVEEVKQNG